MLTPSDRTGKLSAGAGPRPASTAPPQPGLTPRRRETDSRTSGVISEPCGRRWGTWPTVQEVTGTMRHRRFKRLVRARMRATGETYTAALAHLQRAAPPRPSTPADRGGRPLYPFERFTDRAK